MNLARAIDWVEQAILPLVVSTQEIVRLLALENDRLSRELRVPLSRGSVGGGIGAFLPASLNRPERLIQVWDNDGVRVPVWSLEEAYRRYPNWPTSFAGPKFVVYDSTAPAAVLIPKHFSTNPVQLLLTEGDDVIQTETSLNLVVEYEVINYVVASRPKPLVLDVDEFWTAVGETEGQMPEYHELIPKKVSSDLLIGYNDKIRDVETLRDLIERGKLYREEVAQGIQAASTLRNAAPITAAR